MEHNMRKPTWKPIVILKDTQFTYLLSFIEDDQDPKHHFINECEWSQQDYDEIKNFYWFTAQLTAFKGKVEVCSTYMGGNCYNTKSDVLGDKTLAQLLGGYGPQMVETVKAEANALLTGAYQE
jgi:hypothetical protein